VWARTRRTRRRGPPPSPTGDAGLSGQVVEAPRVRWRVR
jgi:hypothetical protein